MTPLLISAWLTGSSAALALAGPGEPTPKPFSPDDTAAISVPKSTVVVQACDGTRRSGKATTCQRWQLEWIKDGEIWGMIIAPDRKALAERRDQLLAFARLQARLGGRPLDPHFSAPGPLVCDTCRPPDTAGRWGEGQALSGLSAHQKLGGARARLASLETAVFDRHAADYASVARLRELGPTKAAAGKYAKLIEAAVPAVAEYHLALENAATTLLSGDVDRTVASIDKRAQELEQARGALFGIVARTVAKAHAGTYTQEGATGTVPTLEVAFDKNKVTATYKVGAATSVWFEGEVALDGSIAGASLMAPTEGKLACSDHTEACGYEYIPSVLRFAVASAKPRREALELWFQRATWVQAPVFTR